MVVNLTPVRASPTDRLFRLFCEVEEERMGHPVKRIKAGPASRFDPDHLTLSWVVRISHETCAWVGSIKYQDRRLEIIPGECDYRTER